MLSSECDAASIRQANGAPAKIWSVRSGASSGRIERVTQRMLKGDRPRYIGTFGGDFGRVYANRPACSGDVVAAIRRVLAGSGVELEDLWDPRSGAGQCRRLSDQLFSAPYGSRATDWA